MKRFLALAAAAAAALVPLAMSGTADAAPSTFAAILGSAKISPDGTGGSIKIMYRCTTADHTSPHSFVSVKQVGSRKLDRALSNSGSSQLAIESGGAWAMSHRNAMNCDSKIHSQVFFFDQVETSSFGVPVMPFAKGWGYVQFCIFDDNYPLPPEGTPDDEGAPYDQTAFRAVV